MSPVNLATLSSLPLPVSGAPLRGSLSFPPHPQLPSLSQSKEALDPGYISSLNTLREYLTHHYSIEWPLLAAPVMSQSNRRGQRGAAREKHAAFARKPMDTVWSQSGKCLLRMKYSWFLHARAHKQHINAASCVTTPIVPSQTCLLHPASKALELPTALPAQCNWEIMVAEGISNILSIPQLCSCKIHTFSLLQSEHVTRIS